MEVLLHSFLASALCGVSGQLHASAALPLGKQPTVLMNRKLLGPEQQVLDAYTFRELNQNSSFVQSVAHSLYRL